MKKNDRKISVIIHTKNEEKNLKACISSVKKLADEIIVVDMQSTDNTLRLARKLGAKTYSVKNYGYVEPARNYAIKKASHEWICVLDADERLTDSLTSFLLGIVKKNQFDAIAIPRKNILMKRWIRHMIWWPNHQIRFFRQGFVTWSDAIHSEPIVKGRVKKLPALQKNAIVHYNISNLDSFIQKMSIYAKHTTPQHFNKKIDLNDISHHWDNEFMMSFFQNEGYKEGLHGFFLSKLMEFYRFLEIAYMWERKNYRLPIDKKTINRYVKLHGKPS